MSLPRDALRAQLLKASPELDEAGLEEALRGVEMLKQSDPLAVLQENCFVPGEKGGQFNVMKLAPNFEMTMYLAQATGSCIVTDSFFRWAEVSGAIQQDAAGFHSGLAAFAHRIEHSVFAFPQDVFHIAALTADKAITAYPALMRNAFKYLSNLSGLGPKPNAEAHLAARFAKIHAPAQAAIKKAGVPVSHGRITCAFPPGGIHNNTINRLLLMSSSERHLLNVPMAFFIEEHVSV